MPEKIGIYTPAPGFPPEAEEIASEYESDAYIICHRNGGAWGGETEDMAKVYAHDEAIREAYEDVGVPSEPLFPQTDPVPEEKREDGKDFYIRHKGGRYFEVVSEEGEPVSEKGMEKDEAEKVRDRLNAGEIGPGAVSDG